MQLYYIYRIFITNWLHDVFSCINACSDMCGAQFLAIFREPISSSICAGYMSVYMAEILHVCPNVIKSISKIKTLKSLKSVYGLIQYKIILIKTLM